MTVLEFRYQARPWTINEERAGNRSKRAKQTKKWREVFCYLAKMQNAPTLTDCTITVTPFQKKGRMQDVAACVPAVKAARDGLVDASVLIDDAPQHLKAIMFKQPEKGEPGLHLELRGTLVSKKG